MSYKKHDSIASLVSNSTVGNLHPPVIGPWKLGKTLGRGATGRVLLATNVNTGQKAAVKVVSKSELNDDEMKNASDDSSLPYGIEREIIIMKLLMHPNVLQLYDVWETSKALYLVLEYVEGGELFDLLVERGPLPEIESVKYFRQIILGTAYCHALGICHRDLKPENILLDSNLNVKIADFGMAALESNGRLLETSCGSPHYAAPEIVKGLKYHGSASDIWSCGVILFALLTGRLPFDDENIRDLLLKVQDGTFEMPTELSEDAQDLISKMLTVDPDSRIKSEHILSHSLLVKYPIPNEDLISVKSLPHPETASKSLGSERNIDKQVLQNLSILWNDRSQKDIINGLLSNGPSPEKTFYALLMRYRHNQEETSTPKKATPQNLRPTPKKKRASQISVSTSRSRPLSFQYKNGVVSSSIATKISGSSSFSQSPSLKYVNGNSPRKSPHRSPRRSYIQSSVEGTNPALPRNLYNEIVASETKGSLGSTPPSLPSKDTLSGAKNIPNKEISPLKISPSKVNRNSIISSTSKKRLSKRKSIRSSFSTNLKRNSITTKLLATYAKLSGDNDWEYMDKQTKRTSATFATLCDKIFNQEEYNEEDIKMLDEDEKQALEYERLMEIERTKHEKELLARRELAKQQKRQKRRSLLSSRKLSILVKDDANNSEQDLVSDQSSLVQPKRDTRDKALRSISEGTGKESELTKQDVEDIKRRSITQPIGRRRRTINLTRRPVSRLDPLWISQESDTLTKAQSILEDEFKEIKSQNKKNRESMISIADSKRGSRIGVEKEETYELPEPELEDEMLSEKYVSELRKSRLLDSELNLKSHTQDSSSRKARRESSIVPKSKIADIRIPTVTRKSRCFSESNKRLSVLTMRSTKESYGDLHSILAKNDQSAHSSPKIPLRTSFADRLDKAGLGEETFEEHDGQDEDDIVIDFDDHLRDKRSSYYGFDTEGTRYSSVKRYSNVSSRSKAQSSRTDKTGLQTPEDTFESKIGHTKETNLIDNNFEDEIDESLLFDNIKLPGDAVDTKKNNSDASNIAQTNAKSLLLPDAEKIKNNTSKPTPMQKVRQSKDTNAQIQSSTRDTTGGSTESKRNKSFFRMLSWGSRKTSDKAAQLPSPADSRELIVDDKEKQKGRFMRWLSGSGSRVEEMEVKRLYTILPKQEISTALYALLRSWSNFGIKDLNNDTIGGLIMGQVSRHNSFNLKGCKFRIKIASRENDQKSEIICSSYKGSKETASGLFREIEKVFIKEGVLDTK